MTTAVPVEETTPRTRLEITREVELRLTQAIGLLKELLALKERPSIESSVGMMHVDTHTRSIESLLHQIASRDNGDDKGC